MRDAIAEFLLVIEHSRGAQVALLLGVLFCQLSAGGSGVRGAVRVARNSGPDDRSGRDRLTHGYDKATWAVLMGFLLAAVNSYRKNHRSLSGI